MRKLTIQEIHKRLNHVHNSKYEYDFSKYEGMNSKIKIICPIHGEFNQRVYEHSKGRGCSKCAIEKNSKDKRNNLNELIIKSNKIHYNNYDYSLINNYKNMHNKNDIICPIHGIFKISFHSHINKQRGCKQCSIDKRTDTEYDFIKKSKIVHGDDFDYSKVNYINSKTKVIIGCPIHGDFKQMPNYHIMGQGCPICKESKGEKKIRIFLVENNILFDYQKKFPNLIYKKSLIFDFYLPKYNLCIEYDGEQHFKPIDYWGGLDGFKLRQIKDNIKTKYCKNNSINLLRISFEDNIIKKLKEVI